MMKTYEEHMKEVDKVLIVVTGLTHHEFGDFCSMESYESESTPLETAIDCLEAQEEASMFINVINQMIAAAEKKREKART